MRSCTAVGNEVLLMENEKYTHVIRTTVEEEAFHSKGKEVFRIEKNNSICASSHRGWMGARHRKQNKRYTKVCISKFAQR